MVTYVIGAGLVIYVIYMIVNICMSESVEAHLIGYDEDSHYDTETGTDVKDNIPVYSYSYGGFRRTYRSMIAIPLVVFNRENRRIFVNKAGKVFEPEVAVLCGFLAVVMFLIGG